MQVIYAYAPLEQQFVIAYNTLWGYYRTRPFVKPALRASESVWIVPGTEQP